MFIRESESEHRITPKTEVGEKKPARHVSLFGSSENWRTVAGLKDGVRRGKQNRT